MRVLFSTLSHPGYMAPPILGDEQVNCGPYWPDATDADGRVVSLHTPAGEYDLGAVAARLPPEQAPDVVVALIDASGYSMPRNLKAFKCPKVVLMADMSHQQSPLVRVLNYVGTEPYDRRVLAYDRMHAMFFQTAGFRQLYWFPGITFPYSDGLVRSVRQRRREPILVLIGQVGAYHPRRSRLMAALQERKLPLLVRQVAQNDALKIYGRSLIVFNCGLNSGINLRNFEAVATGAMLLSERLPPEVGFQRVLADGREVATYGCAEELCEKAAHYLDHPDEAEAIGAAGAAWFDRRFNEHYRREAFRALAFDGRALAEYDFTPQEQQRKLFRDRPGRFARALLVYQDIQELHRTQESVRVALDPAVHPDFRTMLDTLARVRVVAPAPGEAADYHIAVAAGPVPPVTRARVVWYADANPEDLSRLASALGRAGYVPRHLSLALYQLAQPASRADEAALPATATA